MNVVLAALESLNCAELSYGEWIRVGMALKTEGCGVEVWDDWSRRDPARYHPGECEKKWASFRGGQRPVTGGTVIEMAKRRGWKPASERETRLNGKRSGKAGESGRKPEAGFPEARDEEEVRKPGLCRPPDRKEPGKPGRPEAGEADTPAQANLPDSLIQQPALADLTPAEELRLYLETLFRPEEIVSYVTGDAWKKEDGKWAPGRGVWNRTAGELIAELKRYPEDLGAAVGDWKEEAGAWIRFNPLDGKGVRDENVTAFRYALVESDEMEPAEQIRLYRKLELPVAALVFSGGRSVHAIVRIEAETAEEYAKRVGYLYDFLSARGGRVDPQNRNPSRMSRLPGATRKGRRQRLLGVNLGRKSWADWLDFAEGLADGLPDMEPLKTYADDPPPLAEELIRGMLRRGHKMLISGSSKAGKSFLLMELCVAIAEGRSWLGFPCRKGRVLYVNLEIDKASCVDRLLRIYSALDCPRDHLEDILLWNLRGKAVPLDQLAPRLIRRVRNLGLDAIVLDPIYKVITGDENSATDMAAFCNQFDRISTETGCAVIYCHHHSKGAQGAKRAMDRASGSGVFARDPDAQLDMIELELTDDIRNRIADRGATGWRLECSLREFENFRPVNFWFEYPIHRVDTEEVLKNLPGQGAPRAEASRSSGAGRKEDAMEAFRTAYQVMNMNGEGVSVKEMGGYLGIRDRTVRDRVYGSRGEFYLERGIIRRAETEAAEP